MIQETLSHQSCSSDLTKLKHEYEWLREPDSIALQASLEHLRECGACHNRDGNAAINILTVVLPHLLVEARISQL